MESHKTFVLLTITIMFITLVSVTAKSSNALPPDENNVAGFSKNLPAFEVPKSNDTSAFPPVLIDVSRLLTSLHSSNAITGQEQTIFRMGASVRVNFDLCSSYNSGVLCWRLILKQPDNSIYSTLQLPVLISPTPRTIFCIEPILVGVQTGEWTGQVQLFAMDGITPLGAATLHFNVTGF